MNVDGAIHSIELRKARANVTISRYRTKGDQKIARLRKDANYDDVLIAWLTRENYYVRAGMVEDYIEELDELIEVLRGKNPEDNVAWTIEDDFEEEFGIDYDSVEWSNTVATIFGYKNSDNVTDTWVICVLKTLKDI